MMKYVLFTGATGGLGEVCVKALSQTGCWTVFAAGTNIKKLDEFRVLANVIPLQMDITDDLSVLTAQKSVAEHTDKLDAIVNFAGCSAFASMVEGDCVKLTQRLLDVNVMGMIRVNRAFFELLPKGMGRIINCSSEAGWMTAQPFAAPYFLSKRAVESYSDSLRRELMFLGIPVIKIQPGSFQTNMTKNTLAGFYQTLNETKYYKNVLSRLKPLMTQELKHDNDAGKLAKVVLRALNAKRPKLKYRVGTGKMLAMLELFPEKGVDLLYQWLLKLLPDRK
jgi:NAD(P)-dependent dehydrogenase (short-subunit alcohol dehydrogenase family)